MIFNFCIYGSIDKDIDKIKCTYISNDMCTKKSKTIEVLDKYQFNLGDYDFLGLSGNLSSSDSIILTCYDSDGNKVFSDIKNPIIESNQMEWNISIPDEYIESDDEANFTLTQSIIKTSSNKFLETSPNLYNYFTIENVDKDELIYSSNSQHIEFSPSVSDKFRISQYSLNKHNTEITSKTYEFNAIVSAATITRSNRCKSMNDSIKILFMAYDDEIPRISVYNGNTKVVDSDNMSNDVDDVYSYNYVFEEEGYFLFKVNHNDERFIISFRVNRSYYKAYHIEETVDGGSLAYNLYKLPNTDDVILSEELTYIEDGLYSTSDLDIEYGDYLFSIDDESFVVSFEECANIINDDNVSSCSKTEEVFWIFPNNI